MEWLMDMEILRRSGCLHEIIRYFPNFGPPIFNEMVKNSSLATAETTQESI
jgi:hypothetical protein